MIPTMKQLAHDIADKYGVTVAAMEGPERDAAIVRPRHEFWYGVATTMPWISYSRMGRFMGRIDHSTVIKGIKNYRTKHELPAPPPRAIGKIPTTRVEYTRFQESEETRL